MGLLRTAIAASLLTLAAPAGAADLPFDPGEQLRFKVTYFVMTAGEMNVTAGEGSLDGRALWPIEAHIKTRGLVNRFFSLDNRLVSWFDPAQRRSVGSDFVAVEDGQTYIDNVRMDGGKAYLHHVRPSGNRDVTRDVDPASHDILSAIYHLRTLPLAPGERLSVPVFTGGHQSWALEVKVAGRERVKTDAGTFDALKLHCRTHFSGNYKSDRELEIWLSDDERRLPLKVEAFFYVATLRLELKSYSPGLVAQRGLPHNRGR